MNFSLGQVLALRSGSPPMTALELKGDRILVAWFDGVKDHRADYPREALEPYADQIERHRREAERQEQQQQTHYARQMGRVQQRYFG